MIERDQGAVTRCGPKRYPQFIFTSGRRSVHHDHRDYGLKEGLEDASREEVALLESACIKLAQERRAHRGVLIALGHRGQELWRGELVISRGREVSGRVNLSVQGPTPDTAALYKTWSWMWISEAKLNTERPDPASLVTHAELESYVRAQCPDIRLYFDRVTDRRRRRRAWSIVLIILIMGVLLWRAHVKDLLELSSRARQSTRNQDSTPQVRSPQGSSTVHPLEPARDIQVSTRDQGVDSSSHAAQERHEIF